jgi:hypothetical protein
VSARPIRAAALRRTAKGLRATFLENGIDMRLL